jgi:Flp pilus assembly pilin Flp
MSTIRKHLADFCKDTTAGIPHVEYAVALALIIVGIVFALQSLGSAANNQNNSTSTMLQNSVTPGNAVSNTTASSGSATTGTGSGGTVVTGAGAPVSGS